MKTSYVYKLLQIFRVFYFDVAAPVQVFMIHAKDMWGHWNLIFYDKNNFY